MGVKQALSVLDDMVEAGVIGPYAIGGAFAAYRYIQASVTEDIDVLVPFDGAPKSPAGLITLGPIIAYLADRGYTKFAKEGIVVEGWPIQFLPVTSDLDRESIATAVTVQADIDLFGPPVAMRVLTAEHLAAVALKVGRPKDRIRLAQFIDEGVLDLGVFEAIVTRHGLTEAWQAFLSLTGIVPRRPEGMGKP